MQIRSLGFKFFVPQVKCLIHYIHGRLRVRVLVYVGDDLNILRSEVHVATHLVQDVGYTFEVRVGTGKIVKIVWTAEIH